MEEFVDQDLVSIVIPMFNASEFIEECIRSALWQTHRNVEIVVIDDCSTDGSAVIVHRYIEGDSRVRFHKLAHNMGVATARDIGIEKARGKFVAFLDADDIWHPEKVRLQLLHLKQHPGSARAVYCGLVKMSQSGKTLMRLPKAYPTGAILDRLAYSNLTGNGSTVMVERDLAIELGPFLKNVSCEDWDYALRIANRTEFACAPSILVGARVVDDSRSANKRKMVESIISTIDLNSILLGNHSLPKVKALWCASYGLQIHTTIRDRITFLAKSIKYHPLAVFTVLRGHMSRVIVFGKYFFQRKTPVDRSSENLSLFCEWKQSTPADSVSRT